MAPFSLSCLTNFISIAPPSTQLPNFQPKPLCLPKTASQFSPPPLFANSGPSTSLCSAHAYTFICKSSTYNVQVPVEENEPVETTLYRFKVAVNRAGVLYECRRRRFFENSREKKKRKAKDAAWRNRKRPWNSKPALEAQQEEPKKDDDNSDDDDNWEIPEERSSLLTKYGFVK